MKIELARQLFAKYPALFVLKDSRLYPIGQKNEEYEGIDCRDGWYDLLDHTFAKIQQAIEAGETQPAVQQVSQKFGKLKLSFGFIDDEKIRQIKHEAEEESLTICEFCGAPGMLCHDVGVVVACEQHRLPSARELDPETMNYVIGRK